MKNLSNTDYVIVRGWTDGVQDYRLYINQELVKKFTCEGDAVEYINKLKIEKASISTDEQDD